MLSMESPLSETSCFRAWLTPVRTKVPGWSVQCRPEATSKQPPDGRIAADQQRIPPTQDHTFLMIELSASKLHPELARRISRRTWFLGGSQSLLLSKAQT